MQDRARKAFLAAVFASPTLLLFSSCGSDKNEGPKPVDVAISSTNSEMRTQASNERLLICVRSIKLKSTEDSSGDEFETEVPVGLIDANQPYVDWGKLSVPEGTRIAMMKVKVHKSKELCGVDYSIQFGSATTPQDVEFRFRFNPPLEANEEQLKAIQLSFEAVISNLESAVTDGSISSLKNRVEEVTNVGAGSR